MAAQREAGLLPEGRPQNGSEDDPFSKRITLNEVGIDKHLADALEIEAAAKRRLADEYDREQPKEAKRGGRPKTVPDKNSFTAADVGLTRKQIHEARKLRRLVVVEHALGNAAPEPSQFLFPRARLRF